MQPSLDPLVVGLATNDLATTAVAAASATRWTLSLSFGHFLDDLMDVSHSFYIPFLDNYITLFRRPLRFVPPSPLVWFVPGSPAVVMLFVGGPMRCVIIASPLLF